MSERPLVSVVIAVRNGERFIAQAIESVLAQTYDHSEIVVVDGASSDRSVAIAENYPRVRCIQQAGRTGFAGAWNDGIAVSNGCLITILDSDDLWEPRKLELQVELLQRRPEVDYVITWVRFLAEPGIALPRGFKPELLERDYIANMPSALMIRREALDRVGPFRTDLNVSNDIDWFARAKDMRLTLAEIPEALLYKRVHDTNFSYSNAAELNRELLDLLRLSVARQRA